MHGAIRHLADHLKAEYGVLTGQELDLFFDSASLRWGDDWESQIRKALEETTFFIPIITPRYFASKECKRELLGFAEQAEKLERPGLILPLYFVDVPALNDGELDDPVIQLIAKRHREDWRTLRLLDEGVQPYRVGVNRLTSRLLEVAGDRQEPPPVPARMPEDEDEDDAGGGPASEDAAPAPHAEQESGNQELALPELLAEGEEALPRLVETLQAISSQIQVVGEIADQGTAEIEESDEAGKGFRGRVVVMNRVAQRLNDPANELEALTSRYAADLLILDPAIKQLSQMVSEQAANDPDTAKEFFDAIRGMVEQSTGAAGSVQGMIGSMEGDQFSRELQVPLQRMRVALQSLVDGQQIIESWKDQAEGLDDGAER